MKMHKMMIALIIAGFSSAMMADENNLGACVYPDVLSHGINLTAYQQCVTKITRCPKNGVFLDGTCVNKMTEQEASCQQLGEIAKEINVSADFLHLQQQDGFTIIDALFPADGGHLYALLSPHGCLIDTVVDPRDLNPTVKKQYATKDFFLEAKDKPNYLLKPNGTQQFTIDILVKNQCRACELIGTAKIAFDFSKDGKWMKTEMLSFAKN